MSGDPRAPFDRRALSLAISRAAAASLREAAALSAPPAIRARVVGVTGPPGAGKSTLIGNLVPRRLGTDRTAAVLAIDPSSPRSGGAVLGDRIRMEAISGDPRVYIRSLASAGAHDGLSSNIAEVLATLEGHGFDEILIETVGVGQAEYGIRSLVDAEILVLVPGAGDHIQAMKAGIIETADIVVVGKSDLPGADRLEAEILGVLRSRPATVIRVSSLGDEGVARLSDALDRLLAGQTQQQKEQVLQARLRFRVQALIQRRLREVLDAAVPGDWQLPLPELYDALLRRMSGH